MSGGEGERGREEEKRTEGQRDGQRERGKERERGGRTSNDDRLHRLTMVPMVSVPMRRTSDCDRLMAVVLVRCMYD